MQRLADILRIKPGEARLALLVCAVFLCIQAGQGLGDNASSALFFLRFGVDFLPYMYILLGGITMPLTMAYSAGLGRAARGRYFQGLLLGAAGLLLVERLAILRPFPLLYPIVWLTTSCLGFILGTFVWNLAGEVNDTRQAKRLFPLYTSAGILGSVLGNSITGAVARWLGTEDLLILFAILVAISWLLTRAIASAYFRPAKAALSSPTFWNDLRVGYDYVRSSALMRLVAYASVLFAIIFSAVAFPFNRVVTASFPDEARVAGFLGLFTGITTAVTFVVSLLLANRVYARLGIVNSVLVLPITYVLGFAVFASDYSLTGAVAARFAQLVVLSGVAGTAWSALFNVVPSQKRAQVVAFENGLPGQLGVALSGLLLILGDRILTARQMLWMGVVVTLACGYLVWRMRRAYGEALLDALRAGRLEVFTGEGLGFAGLKGDAGAIRTLSWALTDPKPGTRRLAAHILGRMGNPDAIDALTVAADDPEPDVRAAVVSSIGQLRPDSASSAVLSALDDRDERVRLAALASLADLASSPIPATRARVETLMRDPSLRVRMQAMLALARLGDSETARAQLTAALRERDVNVRVAALEAYAAAAASFDGNDEAQAVNAAPVVRLLADTLGVVRVQACRALAGFRDPDSAQALATRLHDADPAVRAAAARSLRQRGPAVTEYLVNVLESEFEAARDAALDALTPGSAIASEPLRRYARQQIAHLRQVRSQVASLPSGGRAARFLCESLQHEVQRGESRLVKIVGLLGNPRAMQLVQKSLRGADSEARSAALEALETLGDKTLVREITALLEQEPAHIAPELVISQVMQHGNRWKRALAVRAIQELGLQDFDGKLHDLKLNPDPLIAETAAEALVRLEDVRSMDTLQTVSTLERVLLLRDIPIFSELSPEDLQQVAAIAVEQWYPKDTTIFRQEDSGNMMFVIVDGHVQVVRSANGVEQVLARRGPGDFVGEMAIIESAPRSASLVTIEDVRMLAIDGETFKGILRERPEVSLAVLRSLSRRLRELGK